MAFQTTVFFNQTLGFPGEQFTDSPMRGQNFVLDSALASYNIIGATAYTLVNESNVNNIQVANAAAGNTGTTGVFVGILVNPKAYASFGTTGGGPLAATLTLANQTIGELATMGTYVVTLPATANVGDLVIFDNVTGALSTIAPSVALPSGKTFAYASVDYFDSTGSGLYVITLTPTLVIPVPA